jgi:imidazole glycerol phosphate synthase subunit HisF
MPENISKFLRPVDKTITKKYEHESGDWIELRQNLSKREVNAILRVMPADIVNGDSQQKSGSEMVDVLTSVSETLFTNLVVGWSVDDSPNVDTYLSLPSDAANWVDKILFEHFNGQSLSGDEAGKR